MRVGVDLADARQRERHSILLILHRVQREALALAQRDQSGTKIDKYHVLLLALLGIRRQRAPAHKAPLRLGQHHAQHAAPAITHSELRVCRWRPQPSRIMNRI